MGAPINKTCHYKEIDIFKLFCKYRPYYVLQNIDDALQHICKHNDMEALNMFVSTGFSDWNKGLIVASNYNLQNIIEYMVARGANNWNEALVEACNSGYRNIKIIELIIIHGATNLNEALYYVCGVDDDVVKLLLFHGAD